MCVYCRHVGYIRRSEEVESTEAGVTGVYGCQKLNSGPTQSSEGPASIFTA